MAVVWREVESAFQTAAGRIHFHHRDSRSVAMAALADVEASFAAYVAAVNALVAELQAAVDLGPLAQQIADAASSLPPFTPPS